MNVDFSKLSRDYRISPLKRGEIIPKQDLQYLFIEQNLTLRQIATIINRHPNQIGRQCKQHNIRKSKEQQSSCLKKEVKEVGITISDTQSLMMEKFPDVIMDYKQPPLTWDFYIPSKNLYIAYHVGEEHGSEPFDNNRLDHWEKVKHWANEAQNISYDNIKKNYYANLINTWTVTDLLMRNTANHNKLNYKEFFTHEQFLNWITREPSTNEKDQS